MGDGVRIRIRVRVTVRVRVTRLRPVVRHGVARVTATILTMAILSTDYC